MRAELSTTPAVLGALVVPGQAAAVPPRTLPFADAKCLDAFAGFERGVYAGLDAGSGQKAA